MLDVGWTELLVIGALALIVVGPRDLPQLLNQVGRWVGQIKRMAREFQRSLEDAARDSDLGDLKELRDLRKDLTGLDFRAQAAKAQSYLKQPVKVEPTAGAKPAQPATGQGAAAGTPAGGAAAAAAPDSPSAGSAPGVAATPPPATSDNPGEKSGAPSAVASRAAPEAVPGTKVGEG